MSVKGYVLKERAYLGSVTPPDAFEDENRFGNDGVHTAITWVKNPAGIWVRSFNGSTSIVDCGSDLSLQMTGDTTFLAWVKVNALDDPNTIVSKANIAVQDRIQLRINAGEVWCYKESANDGGIAISGGTLTLGWHLVGFQFGSGGFKILLDTVVVGSNVDTAALNSGTNTNSRFGIDYSDGNPMTGHIALTKLARYYLSAEQIAAIFQKEKHWFGV